MEVAYENKNMVVGLALRGSTDVFSLCRLVRTLPRQANEPLTLRLIAEAIERNDVDRSAL